ncbi:kinase-like domain-containing protein [Rhizophagus irregularis DAOM 181602=DAOM 197198]|nr:kinase-like domain-containing protein [Rhizophagus irregularis DAOM 181602=DAOM 197198]
MWIVRCFGITKDPKTNNFMMYITIAIGLSSIHKEGLIHHDFHCGNILSDFDSNAFITDLGLSQPANVKSSQNNNKKIYGVLPYVAPEVLRGKEYTQQSDIYGFGIIAYKICTGLPPYYYIAHDEFLAMKICKGLRPKSNYKIPQLIFDIINQCWDADPLKRPNADSVIYGQVKEGDDINKKLSFSSPLISTGTISYMTHPQAVSSNFFFFFCKLGSDSFLFVGCFSFVASESSFFVGQTFWSSLSFFVGMLTFGDLDDCRYYMKGGGFNKEGIFIMYLYFVYFFFYLI